MKNLLSLIVMAGAVVVVLLFLSSTGKKPPFIPRDAAHQGIAAPEGCMTCHAPGRASPLKEGHPPKEQCLVCHKAGKG